jgi:hypothetical protein
VWFDLENNVVGTQVGYSVSASIENYGNGWYRIINTITSHSSSGIAFLGLSGADSSTDATGVIGNTVYVWGLQVTQGDYPTSYIPTSGSTVTRSQDVANNSGNADLFNDSEGVLFLEIKVPNNSSELKQTSLNNGTTNEAVKILQLNATTFRFEVVMASGTNFRQDATVNPYQRNKLALQYKANDYKVFVNGTKQSATQRSTLPTGLDRFSFNRGFSTTDDFTGNVKCVAVFKEALSNDLLERLTGEGYESFRLLAEANNYTII